MKKYSGFSALLFILSCALAAPLSSAHASSDDAADSADHAEKCAQANKNVAWVDSLFAASGRCAQLSDDDKEAVTAESYEDALANFRKIKFYWLKNFDKGEIYGPMYHLETYRDEADKLLTAEVAADMRQHDLVRYIEMIESKINNLITRVDRMRPDGTTTMANIAAIRAAIQELDLRRPNNTLSALHGMLTRYEELSNISPLPIADHVKATLKAMESIHWSYALEGLDRIQEILFCRMNLDTKRSARQEAAAHCAATRAAR